MCLNNTAINPEFVIERMIKELEKNDEKDSDRDLIKEIKEHNEKNYYSSDNKIIEKAEVEFNKNFQVG